LLGSNNNGTNWTILDIQTNQVFTASMQTKAWTVTNPASYNLYRLQIDTVSNPPAANSVQLDEIQLNGPPTYSYWWSFGDGGTSTAQNPQHTYTNPGNYFVVLGVTYGIYTGTNTALITIGPPLTASLTATPRLGALPLTVRFIAQGAGGNGARFPYDTTDDQRGVVTAQGNNPPNETCTNAFDDNSATKWLDFANAFPATRSSWIQYQYANGLQCIVSQYALTTANDSPERDPLLWRLLASNDGGTSWATLDVETNGLSTNRFYRTAFNLTNTLPYNLYRLQIDSVANVVGTNIVAANSVQLSEIELIGTPAYSYLWTFGDGSISSARNPQHTYTSNGTYLVTLTVSDGAAWFVMTTNVSVLPLSLSLAPAPPCNLTLTWPNWATNYTLCSATNLVPPISWYPVTNVCTNAGGVLSVTIPVTNDNRFFQLRGP
jgi:PKD repeat protein